MTKEERIGIMLEIESLVSNWFNLVENLGNECAHTDSIIEIIQKKAKEL